MPFRIASPRTYDAVILPSNAPLSWREYGADEVCDGINDTARIQSIINQLGANGASIKFGPGQFRAPELTLPPGSSFLLEGDELWGTEFINNSATGQDTLAVGITATLEIRRIRFTKAGGANTGRFLALNRVRYCIVEHCHFRDCDSAALYLGNGSFSNEIRNCHIYNSQYGIQTGGAINTNNRISRVLVSGAKATGILLSNCEGISLGDIGLEQNALGSDSHLAVENCRDVDIRELRNSDNSQGIQIVRIGGPGAEANACKNVFLVIGRMLGGNPYNLNLIAGDKIHLAGYELNSPGVANIRIEDAVTRFSYHDLEYDGVLFSVVSPKRRTIGAVPYVGELSDPTLNRLYPCYGHWRGYNNVSIANCVPNRLYASPVTLPEEMAIGDIVLVVETGVVGGLARLGIYLNGDNNHPGPLLADVGEVDCSLGMPQYRAYNARVPRGRYWLAFVSNAAVGLDTTSEFAPAAGWRASDGRWPMGSVFADLGAYPGTLPDPFPAAMQEIINWMWMVCTTFKTL